VQNSKKSKKKFSPAPAGDFHYQDDGYVVLDAPRMEALRVREGLSIRQFAALADVSPNTASRFFQGERVQWQTARKLFNNLGINDLQPYLRGREVGTPASLDASLLGEWRIQNALSQPLTLSNGLQFQLFRLAHTVLPDTFGRGKCYDLLQLATRDQQHVQEQLLRHPTVCRAVAPHPLFPINERVLYSDDRQRFWVIDRWFDGITLAEKLRYGPLPSRLLPQVMRQIVEGLQVLHAHGIIRRELSPEYISLIEPDADVLLTELELAKLLEGVISVSTTWEEDPYRAPEAEAVELEPNVDFYSWAQILVHAVTGRVPPTPADPKLLTKVNLPQSVCSIAQRCLSPSHQWRPHSADEILLALADWKE